MRCALGFSAPDNIIFNHFRNLYAEVIIFTPQRRHVKVSHKGNGVIRIAIPSWVPVAEFIAPPQTASVTCRMVVAGLLAADGSLTGTCTQSVTFDYGGQKVPEIVMELSVPHREDSWIVTVMSLEFNKYYGHNHYDMSRDARYMPVGIVNAMYV